MIHAETLHLVKRKKHASEKELMLFLQRQSKAVDDRAKNFEQLCNAIEPLCFIDELEEDVIYRTTDVGAQIKEFAIDAVEGGLEEISFPRIFGIEQLE